MLLPLKWAGPAEKRNFRHRLLHTRGNQCHEPMKFCSMLALEAVVGTGWDLKGVLNSGKLAPWLAPREPQIAPAPVTALGTGRVPGWKSNPVYCFPCPQGEAVVWLLNPNLLAPSGLCREKLLLSSPSWVVLVCSYYLGQWFHCTVWVPGFTRVKVSRALRSFQNNNDRN